MKTPRISVFGAVAGAFALFVAADLSAQTATATPPPTTAPTATQTTAPAATPAKLPAKPAAKAPVKAQTAASKATTSGATSAASASAKPPATRASVSRALAAERAREEAKRREEEAARAILIRDAQGNLVPEVRAAAAIVYDPRNGDVIWDQNAHDQRSIASLTKMMTALTFIADNPDLTQKVLVTRSDVANASTTYLKSGDRLSYNDLLHLTLIASDNAAARVLARTSEGGTAAFVVRMNERASQLNLTSTHYVDPSGLDADNVSSAFDLSHIIALASSNDELGPIMRTAEFDVRTSTREFSIHSTNRLLSTNVGAEVLGAKTGFITKAGYCLATLLQMPQGSRVAVVVLGAATSATRFSEAVNLFNWVRSKSLGLVGGAPPPVPAPVPQH